MRQLVPTHRDLRVKSVLDVAPCLENVALIFLHKKEYDSSILYLEKQKTLINIKMPTINVFDFLKHYPEIEKKMEKSPLIYMLSSSLDPFDIERAHESPHVTAFLEKPINDEFIEGLKVLR